MMAGLDSARVTKPKLSQLSLWGDANAFHEGRAYRDPRDGKQYPSVTTILNGVPKDLSQYAVNKTLEYVIPNVDKFMGMSIESGIKHGKYRWKDHANERGEVGDGVHNYLEALQTGSWDYPVLDDEQQAMVAQYELLASKHDIVPIYNEVTVADTTSGWFGTFDTYFKLDGMLCMGDFKTSAKVWDTHMMQLAALSNAELWFHETSDMVWEAREPEPIEKAVILHLRADHYEIVTVEDLDLHYRKFLDYTDIWYANEELKKIEKERGF